MNSMEHIRQINSRMATRFKKIEKNLDEAQNIADLFAILFTEIEGEFQIPFVWLTLEDNVKSAPLIEAVESSIALKERLNLVSPTFLKEVFSSGLKPVLVNSDLNKYYRFFPPNRKYFVKSLALVPFQIHEEICGSWNNGDSSPNRYTPEMESTLLQGLAEALSVRLTRFVESQGIPVAPENR